MWTSQPEQQARAYDLKRVGFWADPRGSGGFLTYSENATLLEITTGVNTAPKKTLQSDEVKSFIEKQRGRDYARTVAGRLPTVAELRADNNKAGAGVPCFVKANNGSEVWTLYLDGNNTVTKGGTGFTST